MQIIVTSNFHDASILYRIMKMIAKLSFSLQEKSEYDILEKPPFKDVSTGDEDADYSMVVSKTLISV